MKRFLQLTVIIVILLISVFSLTTQTHAEHEHEDEVQTTTDVDEESGRVVFEKLQNKTITCEQLSNEDFRVLGEYFMGQSTGETHEEVNHNLQDNKGEQGSIEGHIDLGKEKSGCFPTESPTPSLAEKILGVGTQENTLSGTKSNSEKYFISAGIVVLLVAAGLSAFLIKIRKNKN
jgi:hypothetical protein